MRDIHRLAAVGDTRGVIQQIESGTPINEQDSRGRTPLWHAAYGGWSRTVQALIRRGAITKMKSDRGRTLMHFAAAEFGNAATIRRLVEAGIPVDVKDNWGVTPLRVAVHEGNREVVKALLALGANPNSKSKDGRTSIHTWVIARRWNGMGKKNVSILEMLGRHGGNINARDNDGNTPLHVAVDGQTEMTDMITLLLRLGANRYIKNKAGKTPIDTAHWRLHNELVWSDPRYRNAVNKALDSLPDNMIREIMKTVDPRNARHKSTPGKKRSRSMI